MSSETGWLVELKGQTPSWSTLFAGDYDDHWTEDSTKALRFARKVDAESFIDWHGWTEAFASEHAWDDGRAHLPVGAGEPVAWQSIETAPKDGSQFEARYEDGTTEEGVYWADTRYCMIGPPQGSCGPGCVSTEAGHLPVDPTHWRPLRAATASLPTEEGIKGAIRLACEDMTDDRPSGSILRKGCEAAGYHDPDDAAEAFVDYISERVIALLPEKRS